MIITVIVLLVFAILNFLVAIIAATNGAGDAACQKNSTAILLGVIGGLLFYFWKKEATELKSIIK